MLNGILSRSREVRPETSVTNPSHDELVIRVNVLAGQIARLTRELSELHGTVAVIDLEAQNTVKAPAASTVGPIPASPELGTSGRSLMRYIAHKLGKNEDGVRHSLEHSPMFADLRTHEPKLCTSVPLMRWLASEHLGEMRYTIIATGAATTAELVGA